MLDFSSKFGRHANRRLRSEKIIWLTTVDAESRPQPRPVWFHWDGETILIFSEKNKAKLRHLSANPRVALSFNTDHDGGDVVVLTGDAEILNEAPPPARIKAYLRKYRAGIEDLGMDVAEFTNAYAIPIRVTPHAMRGFR